MGDNESSEGVALRGVFSGVAVSVQIDITANNAEITKIARIRATVHNGQRGK